MSAATGTRPPIDPRIRARRTAVTRARGRRRLSGLVVGLVVLVVVAGTLALLHSPLFSARHVTVRGEAHTPRAAVVAAAGLRDHPPLVDVSPGAAARRIEALPWVATATVTRRWPDAVAVRITERRAVAVVAGPAGVALVDATGRVLAVQPDAPAALPALDGVGRPAAPGRQLGPAAGPALSVAARLPVALRGPVRSVTVAAGGEVTLGLTGGLTATLGSTEDLTAKFESLAAVLAGAQPKGPAVIDVSVPSEPLVGPVTTTTVPTGAAGR